MKIMKNIAKSIILIFSIVGNSMSIYANNIGSIVEENVAITKEANSNSELITNLGLGEAVEIIGVEPGFYKIAFEGVEQAFVLDEYIKILEAEAVVVGDDVAIRQYASKSSDIIDRLQYGEKIIVNGIDGDFYRIIHNGGEYFVHSDFVIGDMIYSVQKIEGNRVDPSKRSTFGTVITGSGLKFRQDAREESEVISVLPRGTIVDVLNKPEDNWVEISFNGKSGFANTEHLVIQTGLKPEVANQITNGAKADNIIGYAKKFLGTPYAWGGTNLNRGVDCSGFVYAVMRDNGIRLNRTSRSQLSNGKRVSKSELQKGDLVFFDTAGSNNGRISHVGIYIGDGKFIHSSSSRSSWGVTINSLSEAYYVRTYVASARIL